MKAIIDTNILVRMLTYDNLQESSKAEESLRANDIIIPNQTLCEMVWVLRSLYKLIQSLISADRVTVDRAAVFQGLAFLDAGCDFADGVIVMEGQRLGGEILATFDRKAASILKKAAADCMLLSAE